MFHGLIHIAVASCAAIGAVCAAGGGTRDVKSSLWKDFTAPPDAVKPWSYYAWFNGQADKETITADLEAMKRLGFGGINMLDSRGYHDDIHHVRYPKAEIGWGTPEWYDLVEFTIRECARLGIEFTMNCAASGGTLQRFIDGKPHETDVTSRKAVIEHLDASLGPVLKRVPDLIGTTFTHIYSVSYEGNVKKGITWKTIKDTLYATMREWAHSHGLKIYSEAGGPWEWYSKNTVLDCDQLDILMHNDIPQGEFWPAKEKFTTPDGGRANRNEHFFQRAVVLSARREGRLRASLEAFTHMHRHYSVDPSFLKPLADIGYADGANLLVWHTFTSSPKKYGVPGMEYFAGSHINRNVTWHKDAVAFVKYLGRCQALLQRGQPVDDGEFVKKAKPYQGWGRFRKNRKAQFTMTHRREGDADWFFVAGEGKGTAVFNTEVKGRSVEIWDAVTGTRKAAEGVSAAKGKTGEGKTRVSLDLPVGGSCFVVFAPGSGLPAEVREGGTETAVSGPWKVSFAYHEGVPAEPPAPVVMDSLRDWTSYGEEGKAASTELRYFSGTATYRATVSLGAEAVAAQCRLSLGELKSGLAHVYVNGKDCGTVWCAPWTADVSAAVRPGENAVEIRYVNNWYNRLVGDCFVKPEERVTRTNFQYWKKSRKDRKDRTPGVRRRVCSGPAADDALQPSGLLGPVVVLSGSSRSNK